MRAARALVGLSQDLSVRFRLMFPVRGHLPQTSQASGYDVGAATYQLAREPTVVLSDCANVVRDNSSTVGDAAYRMYGAIVRYKLKHPASAALVTAFLKVKAHKAMRDDMDDDQRRMLVGNVKADEAAKRAV